MRRWTSVILVVYSTVWRDRQMLDPTNMHAGTAVQEVCIAIYRHRAPKICMLSIENRGRVENSLEGIDEQASHICPEYFLDAPSLDHLESSTVPNLRPSWPHWPWTGPETRRWLRGRMGIGLAGGVRWILPVNKLLYNINIPKNRIRAIPVSTLYPIQPRIQRSSRGLSRLNRLNRLNSL